MAENDIISEASQTFGSLHVPVGSQLTLETLSPPRRLNVKMMGYAPDRTILILPPMKDGKEQLLEVGEAVTVRLLVRKKICAFESRIKYRSLQPYTYYHLEYPAELSSQQVRSSERVTVNMPVLIGSDFDIGVGDWPKSAIITDLSKTGSALTCLESFGDKGHEVIVNLDVEVSGVKRSLAIDAIIRNKELPDPSIEDGRYLFGVEFIDVSDENTLALTSFIYETEMNT